MHDLLVAVIAVALCWGAERVTRWWLRRNEEGRIADAQRVLEKHGTGAFFYMPGFDAEDGELRGALDAMEYTGKIVLDRKGNVIGRVMPKVANGPHLRLVVDNT
ncbi:conserved hypothetical protein [Paraburkholderia ribeironis]|uniref:Uncharacterized protein n=1 Tax=Paraburkholderia ribeironis TaxID=1247936 RepID=A0A1N7S171_9BURK|nr:hypothetical protein [Paraburkholderia ribeironis]SIT41086.1 conserved hypothetical protein [Paraburkholderia ribeironis]